MVAVFSEVRRVLRADGTLWLNIGDSYAQQGGQLRAEEETQERAIARQQRRGTSTGQHGGWESRASRAANTAVSGLKPKDLVGIPWRLAFALQADGWYLRSDIIWAKPNPMPESVTDRPTKAHEYVFLLAKRPRYFFDQEAVREKYTDPREGGDGFRWNSERYTNQTPAQSNHTPTLAGRDREQAGARTRLADGSEVAACQGSPSSHDTEHLLPRPASAGRGPDGRHKTSVKGADGSIQHRDGERWPNPSGRNVRSVWEIATQPYPDAHFATYPEELVRRCILAGTSERGCCPECGTPWAREVERGESDYARLKREEGHEWTDMDAAGLERGVITRSGEGGQTRRANGTVPSLRAAAVATTGWRPGCECRERDFDGAVTAGDTLASVPCVVLDPFLGSGTTAAVARAHGRRSIGIELSAEYCALIEKRTRQLSLLAKAS